MGDVLSEPKLAGSGYPASSRDRAESMALIIERWLGNPLVRKSLDFVTVREDDERRAEKVLRAYAGENVSLSVKDKLAYLAVWVFLESIVAWGVVSRSEVKENLSTAYWRKGLASVLEGIAWRGPRKPFTGYAPFLIVWNFTNACNLNCKHCYQNADKPARDELNTEEAKMAVDELADVGVAYIAVSGGEPLVRKDFFEVAERIRDREMTFSLATNGTLLNDEIVTKLESLDCEYVQISLDGARPETHNRFRGKNTFEQTIRGIENAVNSDMTVSIATTITKHNFDEVPDLIEISEDLGVDTWMHYNFIPTGRGKDIKELDLTPEERKELLVMLAEEAEKTSLNLLTTAPQFSAICSSGEFGVASLTHFDTFGQKGGDQDLDFLAEFVGGCGTGRLYCALQPNGDISPCVFLPLQLGNILEDDLTEVWQEKEEFKKIREREKFQDSCGSCNFRNICGGCRARAFGYFDDLAAPDPGCIFNEKAWRKL